MNLQRVKELLAAWETGTARDDELAELRRLLPAVIKAAGPLSETMAQFWSDSTNPFDQKADRSHWSGYRRGYLDGAMRVRRINGIDIED